MASAKRSILAINGGSSSIKFAVFGMEDRPERRLRGEIARIGSPQAALSFEDPVGNERGSKAIEAADALIAAGFLIDWLEGRASLGPIAAVGHRIVHGGARHRDPQRVTPELLDTLRDISAYDPDHLPSEIALIELFRDRLPGRPQVACFDTAFHRDMPSVARILAIPRRFGARGVQRYGFHGLSFAFLMEALARAAGDEAARGRVVLAHLGGGSSLAAVRGGKSVDTTMGFTPAAGVPMGTRSGDLDPGLVWYLSRTEGMDAKRFHRMVNHESGLLGVSETSSDMRDLLARQADDHRAAEAVAFYCYQVRKWIGAMVTAIGGLDTLVFTGGIGENSGDIRARICEGLGFLGLELDEVRNAGNGPVISNERSPVAVRVIRTNEELMIARAVVGFLEEGERA